jgi:hypothetical protein
MPRVCTLSLFEVEREDLDVMMTIPGGAGPALPKAQLQPPCSAHRLLSWGRSSRPD